MGNQALGTVARVSTFRMSSQRSKALACSLF
jgi:hypothetical protein